MRISLILIFLALPLLELAVLIKVGQSIGFWWTVLILVATAIGGGMIVHAQGFAALRRMSEAVEQGKPPIGPVVDSVFLVLAGALMLTPGLLTDALGLLLLIPPLRRALARRILRRILMAGSVHVETHSFGQDGPGAEPQARQAHPASGRDGVVIDGEWEEVKDPRKGSGPNMRPGLPGDKLR